MSMKQFQAGLSKFFTKKWIPILVLLVICFVLITYSSGKRSVLDRFGDYGSGTGSSPSNNMVTPSAISNNTMNSAPQLPVQMNVPAMNQNQPPMAAPSSASNYTNQAVANPSDLLPSDKNSQWANLNPSGGNVAIPDLLQAGYHIGLDTIGQTLKNPNYQLRSDPIIEKQNTGPWQQSTIEPDYGRIPLEVGYGQR